MGLYAATLAKGLIGHLALSNPRWNAGAKVQMSPSLERGSQDSKEANLGDFEGGVRFMPRAGRRHQHHLLVTTGYGSGGHKARAKLDCSQPAAERLPSLQPGCS